MPRLGLTMKDGTIVEWLKTDGETMEQGEPLLEVETEKITAKVEDPASSVSRNILTSEGSTEDLPKLRQQQHHEIPSSEINRPV